MPVVILDAESSGHLGEPRASVVEIGAVACETTTCNPIGAFSSLVRPLAPLGEWSKHAMAVNQISPALLARAPTREEVWDGLINWMSLYKPIEFVLAYNVSFDQKIVTKTWPLAEHFPWGPCVMRAASAALRGDRRGLKLGEAVTSLQVNAAQQPHRALFDAQMAAGIWSVLVQRDLF